jgi:nicotinamidase-related amidase
VTALDSELAAPSFAPASFDIRWERTALVVIDAQYLDAHRDHGIGLMLREDYPELYASYFGRLEAVVVPNIKRLLRAFREVGARIVYLTLGSELPDGADLPVLRRPARAPTLAAAACYRGSADAQILQEVEPRPGELIVNKTSRSPFNSTAIERLLRNLEIETLILTGVTTSACVETTGRDAADRGFQVVIVEDATAEYDDVSHTSSLRLFLLRWGQVWSTQRTVEAVRAGGPLTTTGWE